MNQVHDIHDNNVCNYSVQAAETAFTTRSTAYSYCKPKNKFTITMQIYDLKIKNLETVQLET